jgi:hypothetical protein
LGSEGADAGAVGSNWRRRSVRSGVNDATGDLSAPDLARSTEDERRAMRRPDPRRTRPDLRRGGMGRSSSRTEPAAARGGEEEAARRRLGAGGRGGEEPAAAHPAGESRRRERASESGELARSDWARAECGGAWGRRG